MISGTTQGIFKRKGLPHLLRRGHLRRWLSSVRTTCNQPPFSHHLSPAVNASGPPCVDTQPKLTSHLSVQQRQHHMRWGQGSGLGPACAWLRVHALIPAST